MGGTCFFIGHRDAPDELMPFVLDAAERCITERGIREFLVGGYGRFDEMAAEAVKQLQTKYPEIKLTRLLAYYDPRVKITGIEKFDGSLYPDGLENTPKRAAIVKANRYAVDNSDYVIAFVYHFGNSRDILEYAHKNVAVENLAEKYMKQPVI